MKDSFFPDRTPQDEVVKNTLVDYLTRNRWNSLICNGCGEEFFAKIHRENEEFDRCGSFGCSGYEFLTKPRKKEFSTPADLANACQVFFTQAGYLTVEQVPIKTQRGKTLFAGTAGQ